MRDSFNEINITPLTDIFLVLLIIMMVIAPMLDQQGLNLAVPEVVDKQQVQQDPKIMNMAVTSDNRYFYGDEEVQSADLGNLITAHLKEFPDGMLIQVDDNSDHGAVVKLMDVARNSGITSISLAR